MAAVVHFLRPVYQQRVKAMLALFGRASGPTAAIEIAAVCQWVAKSEADRESARRLVRELVKRAREFDGHRICAGNDGYWLARNSGEWEAYLAARRSHAVFEFVAIRKAKEAVADKTSGQGRLFDTRWQYG